MFKLLKNSHLEFVEILYEGNPVSVPNSISVAAALLYLDVNYTRRTPISNSPRAPFCMMGVCFECVVEIDGEANQRACQVQVTEGMNIARQIGARKFEST